MADSLRYGIIGTGLMGLEHARNIALLPDAHVAAIADPDAGSRERGQATVGGDLAVYADYRELLGSVDAVVIASPNFTHIDLLRDVLQTDLHVLCEKPLCTTLEDCVEVRQLAGDRDGVFFVGMEYRYMPPVARLIQQVRDGAVGRLRMLAIREHRFPFLPKVGDWNRFNRNTGGTLVEKCCHFFDLMHQIVDARPQRVYASGGQDVNHLDERYDGEVPDILDNAFAVVDFENGVRALLDLCMFAEASRNEQEIVATGDRGKLECFIPEGTVVRGSRRDGSVETEVVPVDPEILHAGFHHGATYYEHRAFLDAIHNGTPPAVDVEQGLWAVAVGAAAQQSIAEGRPVQMSELGL